MGASVFGWLGARKEIEATLCRTEKSEEPDEKPRRRFMIMMREDEYVL